MLIFDFNVIGERLHTIRKRMGMTQAEVAESSGLSDRTYANIERGTANMRVESLLNICRALHITPDTILTDEPAYGSIKKDVIIERLNACNPKDRETAYQLISIFLQSLY